MSFLAFSRLLIRPFVNLFAFGFGEAAVSDWPGLGALLELARLGLFDRNHKDFFTICIFLDASACSLDRLKIRYEGSRMGVMISPEDKTAFLRDLAARSPGLRIEGGRAVRQQQ